MTTIPLRHASFLVVAALGLALGGCGALDEEELAEASVSSALQTTRSAGAGKIVVDGVVASDCMTPEAAAAEAAARPSSGLFPADCATKAADGAAVHVELDQCTGAFGRVHLNGGLDAVFSDAGACDKLHAEITDSGDLTGNERPIEYSASADITVQGTLRDIAWAGHWSATTRLGRDAEHTSDLAITIDTETDCIAIDGTTSGHVGRVEFDSTIQGIKACPGACPSAGTLEVHREGRLREKTLTIVFDGSEKAQVESSSGREFEVDLVCNDE